MLDKKAEWESWKRFLQETDPELRGKIREELNKIEQKSPEVKALKDDEREEIQR